MDRSNIVYEEMHSIPRVSEDSISGSVISPAGADRSLQEAVKNIAFWSSTFWIIGTFFVYLSIFTKTQEQLCSPPRDQLSYCKCNGWQRAWI